MSAAETKPETPIARDFAHALELAGQGQHVRLYVAGEDAYRETSGKLRARLGAKRDLVELVDATPRPGKCKSCGAAVLWAPTEKGKSMPLDPAPQKRVVLGRTTGVAHVLDTYLPHWASCPSAAEHRRSK